ncbi:MAG: NUDIX domain-containing protein [Gammaproteobacteria bacterium]|jgi:ADP-ribose pyrophosphatase|uniref:NUDIX domain-containing protein n=1 Tax=unclassified Marinomonas TaxID=196814 RepID=UPI000C1DE0C4|nr:MULTISPECIES: NUDIX domain-containing protein [unclassified Marinomonas]MBU2021288.1 NUDIX domain-containing protein [Gammaproteobacteria bacterium]MBU2239788.1 NUDIX domain-containing protein [Gammaproteobacteria bacterium]MBU2320792.1 NUDIX domain-containing protein [Gammaproteobacteria bacterium]PJE54281.1 NUDIX hydrolase [Marinomonas sp. BSi20584]
MKFKPTYSKKDVEVLADECLYKGFFEMRKLTLKHKKFNGEWSQPMTREMMVRNDAVCVLLFDPVADKVLLIEQFRPTVLRSESPWLLELVAGMVEEGESDEDVARRESFEEAGVTVKRLEYMFKFVPSPGGLVEYLRMYAGEFDSSLVDTTKVHGLDEENEDIKLHLVSSEDAIALLKNDVENASTIMGLQWFALNKNDLLKRWCA